MQSMLFEEIQDRIGKGHAQLWNNPSDAGDAMFRWCIVRDNAAHGSIHCGHPKCRGYHPTVKRQHDGVIIVTMDRAFLTEAEAEHEADLIIAAARMAAYN